MQIPIVLSIVDDHNQYFRPQCGSPAQRLHCRGDDRSLWQACALPTASSLRKLGAELQAVVREYGARATPQRNLLVDEKIGRTLSGIFSGSDGEHVGPTIETNGDQQALGVTSRRDRKGAEVVNSMATPGPSARGMEMIGQRAVSRGVSARGTSSSGEVTTGCTHSCRPTNKTTLACATCAWCQGGKKPSNGKLA